MGLEKYQLGKTLGQGQWGVVRKATRRSDGVDVAIKKVRCSGGEKEGINFQVLREIKTLRGVHHAHVVSLYDVFPNEGRGEQTLSLVFELLASDLEKVLYVETGLITLAHAKGLAVMLLDALAFLHAHQILHRDVKPANLLLSARGVLKLADFGYARELAERNAQMSYECCTLWYRPPELLYGAQQYGGNVDVWGAGCVLVEIILRRPLFRGNSETDQLARIFSVLGRPTSAMWPGVERLRKYVQFTDEPVRGLKELMGGHAAVAIAGELLALDPNARPLARLALDHGFFSEDPPPELRPVSASGEG